MALDIAGMLTGVSNQPVNPNLSVQQQQLAMGANATNMMQGGMESMRRSAGGSVPMAEQLQMAMGSLDPSNPADAEKLIKLMMATGDRAGALKLAASLKDTTKFTKGSTFTGVDEDGAYIAVPSLNTTTGEMEIQYQSVKGELTGGEFSMTASQEAERRRKEKSVTTIAGKFGEAKVEAVGLLPEMNNSIADLESSLELLKTIKTGGPVNLASYGIQEFFGLTKGDKATLERKMMVSILSSLKPIFGGLISDSERTALTDIGANVRRGNPANEAILRTMIDRMQAKADNLLMYTAAETQEEYNTLVKGMFDGPKETEEKTWEQLTQPKD
tara:strand:- start:3973 stop:4959 length:987 start_codon:yes stop_codon:yes gene_type:complete